MWVLLAERQVDLKVHSPHFPRAAKHFSRIPRLEEEAPCQRGGGTTSSAYCNELETPLLGKS
jgi:hypothetical protein